MRELVLAAILLLPDRVQKEAPPARGRRFVRVARGVGEAKRSHFVQ